MTTASCSDSPTEVAVVYEDRPSCLVGAMIATAGLRRHCPELPVVLWTPGRPRADTTRWAREHGIDLRYDQPPLQGWNVKPAVLLELLRTHEIVHWVDSDIVVTGSLNQALPADPDVLVTTEDTAWGQRPGSASRRPGWGLAEGRDLPVTANTGYLRVARLHRPVLASWMDMLSSAAYQEAQRREAMDRPLHMLGDQDAFTALLGSVACVNVPVHLLHRGWDIAQCFGPDGFTWRERLRAVRGKHTPPLIHAMGSKPWLEPPGSGPRAAYSRLHGELSPYTALAVQSGFAAAVGWTPEPSPAVWVLQRVFRQPLLLELPLCAVDALVRAVRRRAGIARLDVMGAP